MYTIPVAMCCGQFLVVTNVSQLLQKLPNSNNCRYIGASDEFYGWWIYLFYENASIFRY